MLTKNGQLLVYYSDFKEKIRREAFFGDPSV
jgi:hypothetical protein